ncbi:MAG: tRNA 2-thiouridine(34) synthase MnmA [Parcubacteria group bacterium]
MNQKRNQNKKNKVLVAMSGGVDSSVAAALLKKEGFSVVGAFMRLNDFSSISEKRAKKVASILKIPLMIIDLRKKFKKKIIEHFLREYKMGRTPNPCVVCNKLIKFGVLLTQAKKLGAEFLATGHYIKKIQNPKSKIQKLLTAKDKGKDQSYFLWKLNQVQLSHALLPIGDYTRAEIEKMAKDFKLPFSGVKKSVEICFVQKTIEDFLKKHLKLKPGSVIDAQKRILGRHRGLPLYTFGQRKGIGLAGGPYYVADKNVPKNQLLVTKNEKDLLKKEIIVKEVNWIQGRAPGSPFKASVKIRYRTDSVPAKIYKIPNTKYKILFSCPQRAVTPGQSAVFYRRKELLGGGIIC